MTDLQILEDAAAKIYTATDTSERKNAEQVKTFLNIEIYELIRQF